MSEERDYITRSEEQGDIYISEDVLAMIAATAALEIAGVSGLSSSTLGEQILGKKSRGVSIQRQDESIAVGLSLTIAYGQAVPDLARQVQEAVRSSLESTTGLTVHAVHIRVAGVTFEKNPKA